jgi:hypothetical protein
VSEAILDPVSEALHNLKQRRDELDRAIAALERIRVPHLQIRRRLALQEADSEDGGEGTGDHVRLDGLTLAAAIVSVLEAAGRPLGNAEIVEALLRGGMRFRGTNPPLAVAQGLSRLLQKPGPILKLGRGRWGLAGFQPRSFDMMAPQVAAGGHQHP